VTPPIIFTLEPFRPLQQASHSIYGLNKNARVLKHIQKAKLVQHHNFLRQNNLKTEKLNIPDDVYVVHSAITVVWRMRWRSAEEPLITWDHTATKIHTRKKVPILRHETRKTLKHKGEKKTFR
jgi:hypothetical protein